MELGRRSESRQEELFVPHDQRPRSEGHASYRQLNKLLAEPERKHKLRWTDNLIRRPPSHCLHALAA
jgi:hypothetical protein